MLVDERVEPSEKAFVREYRQRHGISDALHTYVWPSKLPYDSGLTCVWVFVYDLVNGWVSAGEYEQDYGISDALHT